MLEYLKLKNVGPSAKMELDLAPRLNIITGDNGLGKSFLLDTAWFVSFDHWPKEGNPRLTSGYMAIPKDKTEEALIESRMRFHEEVNTGSFYRSIYRFDARNQSWPWEGNTSRPTILTFYAMADGAVAIYDPFRNRTNSVLIGYAQGQRLGLDIPSSFVFSQSEIWDGLIAKQGDKGDRILCNGLIRDWGAWQYKNGRPFEVLKNVLAALSEDKDYPIRPGEQTRISIDDVRDMPTIEMAYSEHEKESVAVVHASAGLRRIISIAYLLVWLWEEHLRAAELLGQKPSNELLILFDEVESHLHPSWQRKILPSLLEAVSMLSKDLAVQLIATTHSPLVMASLEPHFHEVEDAWFDLDLARDNGSKPSVELTRREFEKLGSAENWLVSEAFDLSEIGTGSIEAEKAMERASEALKTENFDVNEALKIDRELSRLVNPSDPTWARWRMLGKQKGWWK